MTEPIPSPTERGDRDAVPERKRPGITLGGVGLFLACVGVVLALPLIVLDRRGLPQLSGSAGALVGVLIVPFAVLLVGATVGLLGAVVGSGSRKGLVAFAVGTILTMLVLTGRL